MPSQMWNREMIKHKRIIVGFYIILRDLSL